MATFTKAPWVIDKHLDIRDKNGNIIAQVSHTNTKELFSKEAKANARLIVAAPEMYELLQTLSEKTPVMTGGSDLDDYVVTLYKAGNLLDRIDGGEKQ